jgi:hypothetical protein
MGNQKTQTDETFVFAIRKLFETDSSFCDVELIGTDGERVAVHRTILAARSKVFETLLYGKFSEASKPSVSLAYSGYVLRMIAEYCYTDHIKLLDGDCATEDIALVCQLAAAAEYFYLPHLCEKITTWAKSKMDEDARIAWSFLIFGDKFEMYGEIFDYTMSRIITNFAEATKDPSHVPFADLGPSVLESILSDERLGKVMSEDQITPIEEIQLFQFVARWAHAEESSADESKEMSPVIHGKRKSIACMAVDSSTAEEDQNDCAVVTPVQVIHDDRASTAVGVRLGRRSVASDLIRNHIRLQHIKPSELRNVVEQSGLVSDDLLLEAQKAQAINAQTKGSFCIKTTRALCWESGENPSHDFEYSSEGFSTELLECGGMKTGVYIWSMRVVRICDWAWVGVGLKDSHKSTTLIDRKRWLGDQENGWVYGRGAAIHFTRRSGGTFPTYGTGDVITLTLDLTDRGSLHARVGSGDEVCLFVDMLMDGEEKVDRSFVPAVSLTNPGKVRFLGFLTQSSHGEDTTTTSSRE